MDGRKFWRNIDGKDSNNVHEGISIEDEELDLDRDRAQMTEYPTQDFFTRLKVQDTLAAEL